MIIIKFLYWILGSIFIFMFSSMLYLNYANNKLEKEIRMNIYDRKETFEIEINKDNLEIAKKTAYELNYIVEEYRLNDDEMILKFKKNIDEYKK